MRKLATLLGLATGWAVAQWTMFSPALADEAQKTHQLHHFETKQLSPVFFSEGANVGDFNQDGHVDVVSGPYWYAGPDFEEKHEYYPARPLDKNGYSQNFFAFVDDFDQDGWDDILIVGMPGEEAFWYRNPQGDTGHWERHQAFDIVDNESPHYVDITGDGRRELVFHTRGQFGWAGSDPENPTKPWEFHRISPPGPYQRFTHGYGVGDVNGDGRLDIIERGGWFEQPAESGQLWKHHEHDFGLGGAQMFAYDIDGDGDNDIVTSLAGHAYGLAWFENIPDEDGVPTFQKHLIMGDTPEQNRYGVVFSQLHALDMADMDGDGVLDIITGKRHWAHNGNDVDARGPAVLYWFRTVRGEDGVDFVPQLLHDNSGVGTQVLVTDLNGDGLLDIVVGNKLGTHVTFHTTKEVTAEEYEAAQPKPVQDEADQAAAPREPEQLDAGARPTDEEGRALNFGFESGTLEDWTASGEAFARQPMRGDTVRTRRGDMQSEHTGDFWVGTFEISGDRPQGTLTSVPFNVTHRYATFLIAGGRHPSTRVELVRHGDDRVIFTATGNDTENLRPVLADLDYFQGQQIYIRVVDNASGGWGHINFDDFRFHEERPEMPAGSELAKMDHYEHEGLPADEAARVMTLPNGFRAIASASEPDVRQPIAMAIDDRGRLWVAEAYAYPVRVPEEQAEDRILIFEDTTGDGILDSRKVFIEGLNLVSGIEIGFGGVWVGCAPEFVFIPDADGDDVPDGPPVVLLDGWGYHDTHETLNAFIWGPDGWLYGCHGVFTHSLVGKPGTPKGDRIPLNAGIWRYHPTRHEFEVFAQGTSNPWGVDFNDQGQAFLTACVIPHLFHVIQGARYHRQAGQHFNRFTYDDIETIADHRHWVGANPHGGNQRSDEAGGGHAHCGAMIYLGGAWPQEYRGRIFMNNIHGNRINQDILKPDGSGYIGSHADDFLLSHDLWSQIINLRYGPDGQVWMIDWYDSNACHHREVAVHDRTNGRIFKVVYGEPELVTVNLKEQPSSELVQLQLHENDWYVRHARRLLQERGADPAVHAALDEIAFAHADPTRRLRALWALHVTAGLTEEKINRALTDEDPYVRAWGIQLLVEDRQLTGNQLAKLEELSQSDPSPVVRLYLASAADRIPPEHRWGMLRALLSHGEDSTDHNLPLVYWYAAEPLAAVDPSAALELGLDGQIDQVRRFMVRRIGQEGTPAAIALLVAATRDAQSDEDRLLLLEGINTALDGRRQAEMPAVWPETFRSLLESPSPQVRSQATALAVTFGDPQALVAMRKTAVDPQQPLAEREQALASLLKARDEQAVETLFELLEDAQLRGAALRGLAAYSHADTPTRLLALYGTLAPAEKRDALNTLASRPTYAIALLEAVGSEQLAATELSADVVRQLRNLDHERVNALIGEVWGTVAETDEEKAQLIAQMKKMISAGGPGAEDPILGRSVFAKTCQQCHKLFGTGSEIGPELTGSNRANLDYFLENVLNPSALIGKDYASNIIITDDGRVITGIIRQQTDDAITVATANETLVIPRNEIDEMEQSDKSMMPDDLLRPLTETEIRALVAYLASPQQVGLLATADNAGVLFNGKDLSGWTGNMDVWSVEDGEIVGRTEQGLRQNEFLKSDLIVGDFRLKLQVKLVPNTENSGIQFRSEVLPDGNVRGYQADIGRGWWGKLYEEHARGLLFGKNRDSVVRADQWNDYTIEAVGHRVRTWINGQLCVDLEDPQGALRGIIALQVHSGGPMEVRFRNLELEVDPETAMAAAE